MQTTHVAEEDATMPHDSPLLRVHSFRRDEGNMTLNELTVLYTTLSRKVKTLEPNLKPTKLTYGAAYTKLIMKVKKLEHKVKSSKARRRVKLVVSEDEDDTAGEEVSTASLEVKTAAESLVYIRRSAAKRKDKGKAIRKEVEPIQKKTKLQLYDDIVPKVVAGSSKIDVKQELNQETSKRQKIGEGSEPAEESKDELSQEQLQ
ncbi:hypothetical protein Tco_0932392 [Tanacetum coccineum]